MESLRAHILSQIEKIERGRIFTYNDLSFYRNKMAHVAVLLSKFAKDGTIIRVRKGAYYRPQESRLGLKKLPVYQDEQLNYLTKKLGGYISGIYAYNKMSLTEQVPSIITIATTKPTRNHKFNNLIIECVKSYINIQEESKNIQYALILDAIKDIKHIPGTTQQDVYNKILNFYFKEYSKKEISTIINISKNYPPRVRKVVADLLNDIGYNKYCNDLVATLLPTTRFKLDYKTEK